MSKKSSYNVNDVANYLTEAPDFINLYISDLEKQISNLSIASELFNLITITGFKSD